MPNAARSPAAVMMSFINFILVALKYILLLFFQELYGDCEKLRQTVFQLATETEDNESSLGKRSFNCCPDDSWSRPRNSRRKRLRHGLALTQKPDIPRETTTTTWLIKITNIPHGSTYRNYCESQCDSSFCCSNVTNRIQPSFFSSSFQMHWSGDILQASDDLSHVINSYKKIVEGQIVNGEADGAQQTQLSLRQGTFQELQVLIVCSWLYNMRCGCSCFHKHPVLCLPRLLNGVCRTSLSHLKSIYFVSLMIKLKCICCFQKRGHKTKLWFNTCIALLYGWLTRSR